MQYVLKLNMIKVRSDVVRSLIIHNGVDNLAVDMDWCIVHWRLDQSEI